MMLLYSSSQNVQTVSTTLHGMIAFVRCYIGNVLKEVSAGIHNYNVLRWCQYSVILISSCLNMLWMSSLLHLHTSTNSFLRHPACLNIRTNIGT